MVRLPLELIAAAALIPTAAAQASPTSGGTPVQAMYSTRAEAEQAARVHFQCSGAHRMGQHWMPCAQHDGGNGSTAGSHTGAH